MSKPYNIELHEQTEAIRKQTRAGEITREERFAKLDVISTQYAVAHAALNDKKLAEAKAKAEEKKKKVVLPPLNLPDAQALDRLADLCLDEEIYDTDPHKANKLEYPFLSEYQLARRRDGSHTGKVKGQQGESPMEAATTFGHDMRDHKPPVRRKRSTYENIWTDERAKIRNAERRRKYNDFIKPGDVITYKAGERA